MLCTGNFFQRSHHSEQVALSVYSCTFSGLITIYVLDALNVQCPTASDLTEKVCGGGGEPVDEAREVSMTDMANADALKSLNPETSA